MNALKKLIALLLLAMFSTTAFALTDNQVFAYAEANYPSIFTGAATAGQYQQYNYRYYPASRNYLAVDTSGVIFILGPYTGDVITSVGPVSAYAGVITAWESTQAATVTVGAKFSIAANMASVSAAFDGTNYLVALGSDKQTASVAAQMMSSSGAQIGTAISIGRSGQSCCSEIAFDGTNYLMIWEEDQGIKNSWEPLMIYGQFINTSGAATGQSFAITTAGISQDGVKILAYGGGKYLLTYTRLIIPANGDNANNRYIAGRMISPDGTMGNEFSISTGLGKGSSMAFDGTNFFVVWTEDSQDYEVRGRFVSPTGVLGQEISINASLAPSDLPVAVAFDGTNYLVAWNDEAGGMGTHEYDIFGQRVSPNGILVGGVITIVNEAGAQVIPALAFDGANYLAVWTDAKNDANANNICDAGEGTCWDVYGRYISKDGALVGNKIAINTDAGNQLGGVGAYNGKSLVAVNDGIVLGPGGFIQVGGTYSVSITP